jgi:hypothetical protein
MNIRLPTPTLRGCIDRRILVNFRVDPDVARRVVPAPFRPKLVGGFALAGICLLRLKHLRAGCMPRIAGLASENAAHRIAVEWSAREGVRSGVFIPRRDTGSRLNVFAGGGVVVPGEHHLARFDVREGAGAYAVEVHSRDGHVSVAFSGRVARAMPKGSVFPSLDAISRFFEQGSLGYSPDPRGGLAGLELRTFGWRVEPLEIDAVSSSFFSDASRFPSGSVDLDSALLMRGVEHEWRSTGALRCD